MFNIFFFYAFYFQSGAVVCYVSAPNEFGYIKNMQNIINVFYYY